MMNWADAVPFPFLVNEPVSRRVGEIFSESFERAAHNPFCGTKNHYAFARGESSDPFRRQDLAPPENFVGHPVSNPGKTILHEQGGFDRRLPMPIQEMIEKFLIEFS